MKLFAFFAFVATVSAVSVTLSHSAQCESSSLEEPITACGDYPVPPGIVSAVIKFEDEQLGDQQVIFRENACPGTFGVSSTKVTQDVDCYKIPFVPQCVTIVCGG